MQYGKQVLGSAVDASKERSIYMRFHVTLEKAMSEVSKCYRNRYIPNTNISMLDHALQIAGLTEQIQSQDYLDYHLTWLTGLLKDLPIIFPKEYEEYIDQLLVELRADEAARVKRYLEQLSPKRGVPEGERYRDLANRVTTMDAVPCYIQIFELYTYCSLWKRLRWQKSVVEYEGFMCFAYMFFYKAISKHIAIGRNIKQDIKAFFKALLDEFGGSMNTIRNKAELYYKSL